MQFVTIISHSKKKLLLDKYILKTTIIVDPWVPSLLKTEYKSIYSTFDKQQLSGFDKTSSTTSPHLRSTTLVSIFKEYNSN